MSDASGIDPGLGPLAATLAGGRFVITAESPTVDSADPGAVAEAIGPLRGLVDAVTCTDNIRANPHLSPIAAARLVREAGVEPIAQFSCRDRNRLALQSDLLGAAALGVRNVLLMGGDLVTAGDHPDAKPVFDLDVHQLLRTARTLRDAGTYLGGKELGAPPRWLVGAVENPFAAPVEERPARMGAKVHAGAEFIITQVGFDVDVLNRFLEVVRARDAGVRAPILVSVFIPRSARSLAWLRDNVAGVGVPDALVERLASRPLHEQAAEGQQVAIELVESVRGLPGVAGVHLIPLNNPLAAAAVATAVRPG